MDLWRLEKGLKNIDFDGGCKALHLADISFAISIA
jgi:hypothetical protein